MKTSEYRTPRVVIAALVIAMITTACGTDRDGSAATVDESKLDWGNYSIVPRDMTTVATLESGAIQESIRLAEYVPLPIEIDSRLVLGGSSHPRTAQSPPGVTGFPRGTPGLVSGWSTRADERDLDTISSLALYMDLDIARFDTRDNAARAMNILADDVDPEYPHKGALTIPGYDTARAVLTYFDSVNVWVAHDNYVIWLWVSDRIAAPEGPAPLIDLAKRALDKQLEMLQGYRPTPADQIATVQPDIDGLLGHTLPDERDLIQPSTGIYSARAALHHQIDPARSQRAFADAGVDLVASDLDTLYRASDPEAASRLAANFVDELSKVYLRIDSPPGLPTAQCLHRKDDESGSSAKYICYLTYDRYVAEVLADQPQDLYQRVSAQYKLLTHGQ